MSIFQRSVPDASNPAQELIDDEFPEIYRPLIPAALKRAYASADQAYDRLDFLNTPSGRFHRGDLIVIAAEAEFMRLMREEHLPFEPSWDDYASPTGKHLVMRSPGAHITINQVDYPHKKPRWAQFREDFGTPNAEYLFEEWNEERRADLSRKHILLLHGYGNLRFSNLAVPHPKMNCLIWWTSDLLKLAPEESGTSPVGGEGPTESPEPELVEEIIKTIRDA
jgi:hypothetical protein